MKLRPAHVDDEANAATTVVVEPKLKFLPSLDVRRDAHGQVDHQRIAHLP